MYELRPHQKLGAQYISDFGKHTVKRNYVSVSACVSSGKTLLAIAGMADNIKNNEKTFQVFVCPRLNLCTQQAEETYDFLKDNGINASVILYNSAKYDGTRNINVCTDRKVDDCEEFFEGCNHVVMIACSESIWGGKDKEFFKRKCTFEHILKNNRAYGRKNAAIVYDEAHNYESKFSIIEKLSEYFNVSVLMSGTPGENQRRIHRVSKKIDYSIRAAILDKIICKPTLNIIDGYNDDTHLTSAVNSMIANENRIHKAPFGTRALICARSIDAIKSAADKIKNSHVITLHSNKKVVNDDNEIIEITSTIDGVEKSAQETMKLIESIDKKENYFGDDLPIVVFQVDMISEGINIKSFNSVLITSYSETKQMQQIGRVLRDVEFRGHHKKDEDEVNIYAAVQNADDLMQLLINLEEYDLTDDVFNWGKIIKSCNGSSPKDENGIAIFNEWKQIDTVLDIKKLLKMRDSFICKKNSKASVISEKFSKKDIESISEILFKVFKGKKRGGDNNGGRPSNKHSPSGSPSGNSEGSKGKGNKTINVFQLIRELQCSIRDFTSGECGNALWRFGERKQVYRAIGFDGYEDTIDEIVSTLDWRF